MAASEATLLGLGNRRKLILREGRLWDALTAEFLREVPEGARVVEDAEGLWIDQGDGDRECLDASAVSLPTFGGHSRAFLLDRLHREVLLCIVDGLPLPNPLVYRRPWHRDAAMVAMVLKETGNLGLIEGWIDSLRDPFDRNNAGQEEPDNLGETLFLVSLVSDASHPAVRAVLDRVPDFLEGGHLTGSTDFGPRPVYQTKWLKLGLRALGLDDPYEIPEVYDSYSALFWMDFREQHVPGPPVLTGNDDYPYLQWAEAHFHQSEPPMRLLADGPLLTWEAHASQADYAGMAALGTPWKDRRRCAPHSWHAAEAFLYLLSLNIPEVTSGV